VKVFSAYPRPILAPKRLTDFYWNKFLIYLNKVFEQLPVSWKPDSKISFDESVARNRILKGTLKKCEGNVHVSDNGNKNAAVWLHEVSVKAELVKTSVRVFEVSAATKKRTPRTMTIILNWNFHGLAISQHIQISLCVVYYKVFHKW
jgi:hypothetical protein